MSIKLIAVDIDGTLVNSKKEINSQAAIQDAKQAGVKADVTVVLSQALPNLMTW